jgi:hypothetical protein
MPFDPTTLFEPHVAPAADPSAEIEAVADRNKPIAMFSGARSELDDLVDVAFEHELTTMMQPSRIPAAPDDVDLFVLHPDQAWRVPALAALWDTSRGRWTDAAEDQQSLLLGYSADERTAWQAERSWRHAGPRGITIYAVLSAAQSRALDAVGRRCFPLGTPVFFHPTRVIRRDALGLIPRGKTLARAGLEVGLLRRTFATITPVINAGLTSNVQLLSRAGWQ